MKSYLPSGFAPKDRQATTIIVGGLLLFFLIALSDGSQASIPSKAKKKPALPIGRSTLSPFAPSPCFPLNRSFFPPMVFAILKASRVAQEAGQSEKAQNLWLQAQRLYPSICKPAWLLPDAPGTLSVSMPERRFLLDQASQTSDPLQKQRLEALLKANPLNIAIRLALLRLAQGKGDEAAVQRHQSIIQPRPDSMLRRYLPKSLGAILLKGILLGAIFWCLFTPLPGSKTAAHPEGKRLIQEVFRMIRGFLKGRRTTK